jgi:hypothetical protein
VKRIRQFTIRHFTFINLNKIAVSADITFVSHKHAAMVYVFGFSTDNPIGFDGTYNVMFLLIFLAFCEGHAMKLLFLNCWKCLQLTCLAISAVRLDFDLTAGGSWHASSP